MLICVIFSGPFFGLLGSTDLYHSFLRELCSFTNLAVCINPLKIINNTIALGMIISNALCKESFRMATSKLRKVSICP